MPDRGSFRRPSAARYAAEACLCVLLFACPLVLGGAPVWMLWPLVALSGAALVLVAVDSLREQRSLRLPWLALLLGGVVAFCLLQLVPLTPSLLGLLSPQARELRAFTLEPLGLGGGGPVSLDPAATWREVAKHAAYLCALVAATYLSSSRQARRRLLGAVALSGFAVALVGYGHALAGEAQLFGRLAYSVATPFVTTFGNPNHQAAFLGLAATVALGLALDAGDRRMMAAWAGVGVLTAAAVFLTLSRAGIVAFVFTQALLAVVVFRARVTAKSPQLSARRTRAFGLSILAALGLAGVVGGAVAYDSLSAELQTADSLEELSASKVELWPMLAAAAARFSRAGMGRGAFEPAFTRFQDRAAGITFTHPENGVLQLWSELGLLPTLLLLALGGWALAKLLLSPARAGPLAALCGVVGLLVHDLFDFSLELPPAALAAAVCLGVAVEATGFFGPSLKLRGAHALAVALAVSVSMPLALWRGQSTLPRAEARLADLYRQGLPGSALQQAALPLWQQHPADYLLYSLVGEAYASLPPREPRRALAFVNRALFLRPLDVRSHRTAARALLALGKRGQAFFEYRLAYETGIDRTSLMNEVAARARDADDLHAFVGRSVSAVIDVADRFGTARPELTRPLLRWSLEELRGKKGAEELWVRSSRQALADKDLSLALQHAIEAQALQPDNARAVLAKTSALYALGRVDEAVATLEQAALRQPGAVELSFRLAELLMANGRPIAAREALDRVSPFVRSVPQRVQLLRLEAQALTREGRLHRALDSTRLAIRLSPKTSHLRFEAARALERLGQFDEAAKELEQGISLQGGSSAAEHQAWLDRLRGAARARSPVD